jgi:alcohol/geraniol dehydrogenase (NADP+)
MPVAAYAQRAPGARLEPIELPDFGTPPAEMLDVDVMHCSVCHSDVHLLDGDWGEVARPLVPGHEIVGRTADGRLVGIGWQAGSCGACAQCQAGDEHLCTVGKVKTCMNRPGGFATKVRVHEKFAFEIPNGLDAALASPLLCAGLTTFSPLERLNVRAGMRVGVIGFGGLGHLAVQFAKALGARVVAFDPDTAPEKRDLALRLGADELVDSRGALPERALDVLLVTTHANLDWNAWMRVLDLQGTLCLVGVPSAPVTVHPDFLLDHQKKLTGSVIGSPATMRRMLAFAAQHGIAPIIEQMPMAKANEAIDRVRTGAARMRIVLSVAS